MEQNNGGTGGMMDNDTSTAHTDGGADFYTCRKCGTLLFTKDIVMHDSDNVSTAASGIKATWANPPSTAAITARADSDDGERPPLKCSSVFLSSAPNWVGDDVYGMHDGRLACPKCNVRVGSFSWSGATCSCGRWITPAFQFHLSRMDARTEVLPSVPQVLLK